MAKLTGKTAHVDATQDLRSPDDLVTAEDFLAWCDEDTHAEWIRGKVQMMSPASTNHQLIVDFLIKVLGIYVEQRQLGTLIRAPEFYRLEGARYATALAAAAGVYESPVLAGFRLKIEWLWQEPLPLALNVLRELGVA